MPVAPAFRGNGRTLGTYLEPTCNSRRITVGPPGMSRTIEQRTNLDGFPKASEMIEMSGLEDLEASQRAISNLLYQHAHESGRIADPTAVFEIPMATLRTALSKHESEDRVRASLTALMRVIVRVASPTAPAARASGRASPDLRPGPGSPGHTFTVEAV